MKMKLLENVCEKKRLRKSAWAGFIHHLVKKNDEDKSMYVKTVNDNLSGGITNGS